MSGVPVLIGSLAELRDWLVERGIPVAEWGVGGSKRVADLWAEIEAGESVLTDPPPERLVAFVSVVIRRAEKKLVEVAQVLATGGTRKRGRPPGEKIVPGESVEEAAFRCVEEELGVARGLCRVIPGTHAEASREGESPSYPGLLTRYRMHEVDMVVPGLPAGPFSTRERGDSAVAVHYWDWV